MMNSVPVKILLVEDSPSDAELLQEEVEGTGLGQFEFTHVERLDVGLGRLQQGSFDVLLLDLSLPDSSGRDTFMRARAAAPLVPIVVLTGSDDERVGMEAVRKGVQEYLIKGQNDGRQIARTIRYAIERKRAEEALREARDKLEVRVQERTAELTASNVRLEKEILQRRHAEETISNLSGRLMKVQDDERRRIARELHDSTAQKLAALAINLGVIERSLDGSNSKVQKLLDDSVNITERTLQEIRTLSYLLHPPLLDELGLVVAMRTYAEGFSKRSGVHVEMELPDGFDRLPADMELALFRIMQESLGNILRHSGSKTALIRLKFDPGRVELEVQDEGCGFGVGQVVDANGPSALLGVGIAGMQERLRQLGGRLEIKSGTHGTVVRAVVPLQKNLK